MDEFKQHRAAVRAVAVAVSPTIVEALGCKWSITGVEATSDGSTWGPPRLTLEPVIGVDQADRPTGDATLELEGLKFTTVASGVTWQHKGSVYLLTWAAARRLSDWLSVEFGKHSDWAPMGFNRCTQVDLSPETLTAAVWNGEGLPPVGCECACSPHANSSALLVVGFDELGPVGRWINGPDKGKYFSTAPYQLSPLRTAEQLAAEAREKAIAEMAREVGLAGQPIVGALDLLADVYDAGYRKADV